MIRLDRSTTSIVVTCTLCAHWSAFSFTEVQAYAAAADHEARCHGISDGQARNLLDQYRHRERKRRS